MTTVAVARVLILASQRGLTVARALQRLLDRVHEPAISDQGVFGPNGDRLVDLIQAARAIDFAVHVIDPSDDVAESGENAESDRDDALFELGLLLGMLGTDRCFLVLKEGHTTGLPSALESINPIVYRIHGSGDLDASLGPVASTISEYIRNVNGGVSTTSAPQVYSDEFAHTLDADLLGVERIIGTAAMDAAVCDFEGVDLRGVSVADVGPIEHITAHPAFIVDDRRQSIPPRPNRPKAHLVDWQAPIIDQGNKLGLELARSDYWTSEATRRMVSRLQLEILAGRIDLTELPRRLDVHLVVVCEDDNRLLLTRRSKHVETEPSTWMITVGESMDWERDIAPGGMPHPTLTAIHCLTERDELNLPRKLAEAADFRLIAIATEWDEMLVNLVVLATVPGLTARSARGFFRRGENVALDSIEFVQRECQPLLTRGSFSGSRGHASMRISDISRVALFAALENRGKRKK